MSDLRGDGRLVAAALLLAGALLSVAGAWREAALTPAERVVRYRTEVADACRNFAHTERTGEWSQLLPGDITYCKFMRKQYDSALMRVPPALRGRSSLERG